MFSVELIYNLSLLVSLSVLSGFVDDYFHRSKISGKVLQGVLFGFTAIIEILYPFAVFAGVLLDGRSIAISLCALFFGPIAGVIAASMAVLCRIYIGGAGVYSGILIILTSLWIGSFFHAKRCNYELNNFRLYAIGVIVHIVMLLDILALPFGLVLKTYEEAGITIFGIFPLATLLVGRVLLNQEKRAVLFEELASSEAKFRSLADLSPNAIFIYQEEELRYINKAMTVLSGYTEEELGKISWWDLVHEDHKELVKSRWSRRMNGEDVESRYQVKLLRKQGEVYWADLSATVIEYEGKKATMGTSYDITERVRYMQEVKEQKELFETTLYSIGDAVITTDTDGHIQHMNRVAEMLTGWSEKEAKTQPLKHVFRIINEGTRKVVTSPADEVLAKGRIVGLANHTLLISKFGKEIPIADSGAPIKNSEGKIVGVVLVFRDQTEEHLAEKRLKESENKFRSLVNYASDGIYLIGDRGYSFVNDRFAQITGYSKEELLSRDFVVNSLLTEESRNIAWQRYLARQREEILPATYELTIITKTGSVKNVELSTVSIGDSESVSVIGIMRDISERKENEKLILDTMGMLERAEEQVDLGSWSHEIDTNKDFWSKQMYRLFNLSYSEEVPSLRAALKLFHPDDRSVLLKALSYQIHNDEMCRRLGVVRTNPETVGEKYIQPSFRTVRDESGRIIKHEGTVLDVTGKVIAEKELIVAKEKAERANQLKSEFLAQVSHEIRSPLNAVMSFSSIIKEETKEYLNEDLQISFVGIESASMRVIRTIDLILNMSELQLGTYNTIKRKFNLVDLLKNLVREYKNLALTKNLDLILKTEIDVLEIETDDYAVNQIFANLIDNAIKYTKEGFIEVVLAKDGINKYRISVKDSGIGMSKDYQARLFDPFTQEYEGYSRKFEGSGLGMALVKKYVDLIQGTIEVESKKDKGTTFTVTLFSNPIPI